LELGDSTVEIRKLAHIQDLGGLTRSLIFFICFYLYLLLVVDLRFIYHGAGEIINFPSFFKGWAFFEEFVSRPGGLVEYTSAFLSQFFYIGWAGALVATLQAWSICACVGYFFKAINYSRLRCIRFIPPLLLLVIYTQYAYHFVTITALFAALLFVCVYTKIMSKSLQSGWLHLVIFVILSVILYYVAAGAYLLFAVLCAIYELLFSRRWLTGLLCLLSCAAIPYVEGVWVFGISIVDAFSDLLPFSWKIITYEPGRRMITIVYLVYLLMPLTVFILGIWYVFVKLTAKGKHNERDKRKRGGSLRRLITTIFSCCFERNQLKWTIETLFLFGIAVGAVFLSYDIETKTLFEVDYYACHKMWPQVLKAAHRYPDSFFIIHAVNRALYHSGRLDHDMFSYPQHSGTLFLTAKGSEFAYWKKIDLYLDLGLMNMAQNDLTECLEAFGERPIILKRLALVNMVRGNIGSARIYLGALSKTLFDAKWAENYLDLLQSDPNLATDSQIQHLRPLMLEKDHAFSVINIEGILSSLLEKNVNNRMAFEYLMSWYLITKQLDRFIRNLDRLDDFNYSRIPRLYEEAILIHLYRTRKPINLYGRQLTSESKQRFEVFSQTYERYGRSKDTAFEEMAKEYGDSYLFYYIYGFSGMKEWASTQ